MGWFYLVCAGVLEVVWATAMKFSHGLTRPWPSAIGIASAVVSFLLLVLALKSLPVGTAYAVWAGIGVAGVALYGIIALNEPVGTARLGFLVLILVGIIGLKLAET
jgi:quaternary ammonium compound-resistance protein SugE